MVDILEVPLSSINNRYSLVVQDYFTKWATAVALPDQTAIPIMSILVKLFSEFGVPKSLHSDQERNFESTILRETLDAFGVNKHILQPITPNAMEWWSGLTALFS